MAAFKLYYQNVRHIIGNHYSTFIDEIVANITGNIEKCGKHHFMYKTTFNAKSSSIVEAMNGPLKIGSNPVNSSMNLATSANVQKQQSESREHIRNIKLAQRVKSFSTFTKSGIKDIVTDFIDLRLCSMHDNKEKVTNLYWQ